MRQDELHNVVERNEAAKQMRKSAAQVRLRSLDALIRSSRIRSNRLAGFREVSQQMRRWSDELERELGTLAGVCSEAVMLECTRRNQQRRRRLLTQAYKSSPRHQSALRAAKDSTVEVSYRKGLRSTIVQLERLSQLGLMAVVLSRTALFEATNAVGDERAILVQAANEFRTHADAVSQLVATLLPGARRSLESP